MNQSNRNWGQPFADAVSIDCYSKHTDDPCRIDIHAGVVFDAADFGDEDHSPVTFNLSLKNAELVFVIPEYHSEAVFVDKETVAREHTKTKGKKKSSSEKSGEIGFSFQKLLLKFGLSGTAKRTESIVFESDAEPIAVTCSKTTDGHYRWRIESATHESLKGPAWDILSKRLTVVQNSPSRLPPSLRLEVHCKRSDLHITGIRLKRSAIAKYGQISKNKYLAVEAYIRTTLFESGLIIEEGNSEKSRFVIGAEILEL